MIQLQLNRNTKLYRSLRWMYQPIKAFYQELKYVFRRKAKILECQNVQAFSGLHIGSGGCYMPGWLNTDLVGNSKIDFTLDISTELPLPDNFFDAIYGSEVIEHIELAKARLFMREAQRILKPGGVMRLTTPDITEICRIFLGLRDDVSVEDFSTVWLGIEGEFSKEIWKEIWINSQFRAWGHKHLWTFESLSYELAKAGFSQVQRCEPHKTKFDKAQLNSLDNRYGDDPPPWIFASTLIIEAQKPVATTMVS